MTHPDQVFEEFVDEAVEDEIVPEEQESGPCCTDENWVDYIFDQLSDRELINGAPTTDGLRRVTEKVFGAIIGSDTDVLEVPKTDDGDNARATVKHTLTIEKHDGMGIVQISACVDVLARKLPAPFNYHLISTACTRAEGKALRRALKIRVQTLEELTNDDDLEVSTSELANDQQIAVIKTLCKRHNVNLVKLVKNKSKAKNLKEVSNLEARLIFKELDGFQRNKVDKEFKGYDANWESKFGG